MPGVTRLAETADLHFGGPLMFVHNDKMALESKVGFLGLGAMGEQSALDMDHHQQTCPVK
jgi:hypothetical protein